MTRVLRSANAEFQVLSALRTNRQTRNRENAFVVDGVRNIDAAFAHRWGVRHVLSWAGAVHSSWAEAVLDRAEDHVVLPVDLFDALTDREERPELVVVAEKRRVTLDDLPVRPGFVASLLDRPASPGNIGTIIRTTDAFGAAAVCVMGHGADPYDPRAIRASTGSFFSVPVVEVDGVDALRAWATADGVRLVATDESGDTPPDALPPPPALYLFGNETTGLSRGLRDAAEATVAIPMRGGASSLNVAAAHAIVLFSSTRQG